MIQCSSANRESQGRIFQQSELGRLRNWQAGAWRISEKQRAVALDQGQERETVWTSWSRTDSRSSGCSSGT
jgi:hypothetical protein